MLKAKIDTLQGCELFAGLGDSGITRLAEISLTKKVGKGEVIFLQDQPADAFYVVQSGSVKIHRINPKGKEQILHVFHRHDVFAEVAALDGQPFPATATGMEPSVILRLDIRDFTALLTRAPEVCMAIIATLCKRLRGLSRLAADLSLKEVDGRLAQYLYDQAKRQGLDPTKRFTITLPTSKTDLAAQIGTVNETLSRTLKKLTISGLISVDGEKITVHKPSVLASLLEITGT